MASFKVPCPSCEHQVPVKDESLVGTKIECPKCKYRFKVEEPAGGLSKDAGKKDKDAAKAEKKKADGSGKKKSKKTVAVIVGVLAVGVLAAVGFAVMGGGKDNAKGGPKGGSPKGGGGSVNPGVPGNPGTPGDPNGGTGDPVEKKDDPKVDNTQPKIVIPGSDKETTNLLPGATVALYRCNVPAIRQTPAAMFFDRTMKEMFRDSLGINDDQVAVYYHTFVGETRDPIGIIRLKQPVLEKDVVSRMAPATAKPIKKKWNLYAFKSNPFINGVSNTLAFGSLFGELYEKLPPGPTPPANRPFGLCVFDSQHILIGDAVRLEKYLDEEIGDKGYPKFKSAVGTPPEGVAFADNPLYLSIEPKLKQALKELGSETQNPPPVLYAEKFVKGSYDPKLLKSDYQAIGTVLEPVLNRTEFLTGSIHIFETRRIAAVIRLVMKGNGEAFEVVKEPLTPALTLAAQAAGQFLGVPVTFYNSTSGGTTPGTTPGMGFPMSGMGFPPMPGAGDITRPSVPGPGSGMGPSKPGLGGSGMGPPRPGGGVFPPGMGSSTPPMPMGEPGTGMPGMPGTGTPMPDPKQQLIPSRIELGLNDQNITITVDLNWTSETYREKIEPRLVGIANTIKGKMAVFASDVSFHRLAFAVPEMTARLKGFPAGTSDRSLSDASRYGLKYPPNTRVSFFVELLPHLGPQRAALADTIKITHAWNESDPKNEILNLEAAEEWVPELLVPAYPQSAWRATSPFVARGRVLGGTNYVAIAGVGLDSARYDPNNPLYAKKVGITGYDWGSKVDPAAKINEVPDGLANTIYLMQTPPGMSQPWLQGGGATVRGLDENDPMQGFRYDHGNGKIGTFALMGDGSIRWIPGDIKKDLLLAMATRAGGETFVADRIDKEAPLVFSPHKKIDTELKVDPKLAPPKDPKADPKVGDPKAGDPKKGSDSPVDPTKTPDKKPEPAPAPSEKK